MSEEDLALAEQVIARNRQLSKSENSMFSMFLQSALAEVSEYTTKIKEAKTQAKRDFYQKKIKKVTKRLQQLLPRK